MSLNISHEFLLRVRNHLHYLSGRKSDQLTFDYQEEIAHLMGYRNNPTFLAVEQFMRSYYRHAANVSQFLNRIVERAKMERGFYRLLRRDIGDGFRVYRGELYPASQAIFQSDPARIMRAFDYSVKYKARLSGPLKELIRQNLTLIDDKFRTSPEVNRAFLNLLRPSMDTFEALNNMHELGVLGRYIPEFGRIYRQVQYDAYHIYTVDIHSLFTARELIGFMGGDLREEFPLPSLIAQQIKRPDLLTLSGLLHDIGKGSGRGHSEKGAAMVKRVAERMGLSPSDGELLSFLIERHLIMVELSQRRDLSDHRLIIELAKLIQEEQTLKMLYLLALADLKSVGPEALSHWKEGLLEELYLKIAEVLEKGDWEGERIQAKIQRAREEVAALLKQEFSQEELEGELRSISPRYLLSFSPEEIAGHIRMAHQLGDNLYLSDLVQNLKDNCSQFIICTRDKTGLFAQISGAFAANGINILSARINTREDGIALDIFDVNDGQGNAVQDDYKWNQFHTHLKGILSGEVDVGKLVAERRRPSPLGEKRVPRVPAQVIIDNDVSEHYTVIDVYAHDRIGLLYDIARTITSLGLTIDFSKIGTKVDQAVDVFYVKDLNGAKILDEDKLEEIRGALLEVV